MVDREWEEWSSGEVRMMEVMEIVSEMACWLGNMKRWRWRMQKLLTIWTHNPQDSMGEKLRSQSILVPH